MPIKFEVIEDGHAVHYTIEDPIEIRELMETYKKEREYRDSVMHTVHGLVDMSRLRRVPTNWLFARQGPGLSHRTSGELLFVGLHPGVRIIIDTVLKLAQYKRIKLFKELSEARQYLHNLIASEEKTLENQKGLDKAPSP